MLSSLTSRFDPLPGVFTREDTHVQSAKLLRDTKGLIVATLLLVYAALRLGFVPTRLTPRQKYARPRERPALPSEVPTKEQGRARKIRPKTEKRPQTRLKKHRVHKRKKKKTDAMMPPDLTKKVMMTWEESGRDLGVQTAEVDSPLASPVPNVTMDCIRSNRFKGKSGKRYRNSEVQATDHYAPRGNLLCTSFSRPAVVTRRRYALRPKVYLDVEDYEVPREGLVDTACGADDGMEIEIQTSTSSSDAIHYCQISSSGNDKACGAKTGATVECQTENPARRRAGLCVYSEYTTSNPETMMTSVLCQTSQVAKWAHGMRDWQPGRHLVKPPVPKPRQSAPEETVPETRFRLVREKPKEGLWNRARRHLSRSQSKMKVKRRRRAKKQQRPRSGRPRERKTPEREERKEQRSSVGAVVCWQFFVIVLAILLAIEGVHWGFAFIVLPFSQILGLILFMAYGLHACNAHYLYEEGAYVAVPETESLQSALIMVGVCILALYVFRTSKWVLLIVMAVGGMDWLARKLVWQYVLANGLGGLISVQSLSSTLDWSVERVLLLSTVVWILSRVSILVYSVMAYTDRLLVDMMADCRIYLGISLDHWLFDSVTMVWLRRKKFVELFAVDGKYRLHKEGAGYAYTVEEQGSTTVYRCQYCCVCNSFDHSTRVRFFSCQPNTDPAGHDQRMGYYAAPQIRHESPEWIKRDQLLEETKRKQSALEAKNAALKEEVAEAAKSISVVRNTSGAALEVHRLIKLEKELLERDMENRPRRILENEVREQKLKNDLARAQNQASIAVVEKTRDPRGLKFLSGENEASYVTHVLRTGTAAGRRFGLRGGMVYFYHHGNWARLDPEAPFSELLCAAQNVKDSCDLEALVGDSDLLDSGESRWMVDVLVEAREQGIPVAPIMGWNVRLLLGIHTDDPPTENPIFWEALCENPDRKAQMTLLYPEYADRMRKALDKTKEKSEKSSEQASVEGKNGRYRARAWRMGQQKDGAEGSDEDQHLNHQARRQKRFRAMLAEQERLSPSDEDRKRHSRERAQRFRRMQEERQRRNDASESEPDLDYQHQPYRPPRRFEERPEGAAMEEPDLRPAWFAHQGADPDNRHAYVAPPFRRGWGRGMMYPRTMRPSARNAMLVVCVIALAIAPCTSMPAEEEMLHLLRTQSDLMQSMNVQLSILQEQNRLTTERLAEQQDQIEALLMRVRKIEKMPRPRPSSPVPHMAEAGVTFAEKQDKRYWKSFGVNDLFQISPAEGKDSCSKVALDLTKQSKLDQTLQRKLKKGMKLPPPPPDLTAPPIEVLPRLERYSSVEESLCLIARTQLTEEQYLICRVKGDCCLCGVCVIECHLETCWLDDEEFVPVPKRGPVKNDPVERGMELAEARDKMTTGIAMRVGKNHKQLSAALMHWLHQNQLSAEVVKCSVHPKVQFTFNVGCSRGSGGIDVIRGEASAYDKQVNIVTSLYGFAHEDTTAMLTMFARFTNLHLELEFPESDQGTLRSVVSVIPGRTCIPDHIYCGNDRISKYPFQPYMGLPPMKLLGDIPHFATCTGEILVGKRVECDGRVIDIQPKYGVNGDQITIDGEPISEEAKQSIVGKPHGEYLIEDPRAYTSWLYDSVIVYALGKDEGALCRELHPSVDLPYSRDSILLITDTRPEVMLQLYCLRNVFQTFDLNAILSDTNKTEMEHWTFRVGSAYVYRPAVELREYVTPTCRTMSNDFTVDSMIAAMKDCGSGLIPVSHFGKLTASGSRKCTSFNACPTMSPLLQELFGETCAALPSGMLDIKIETLRYTGLVQDGVLVYESTREDVMYGAWSPSFAKSVHNRLLLSDNAVRVVVHSKMCSDMTIDVSLKLPVDFSVFGTKSSGVVIVKPAAAKYLQYQGVTPVELSCTFEGIVNITDGKVTSESSIYVLTYRNSFGNRVRVTCGVSSILSVAQSYHTNLHFMKRRDHSFNQYYVFLAIQGVATLMMLLYRFGEERHWYSLVGVWLMFVVVHCVLYAAKMQAYVSALTYQTAFMVVELIAGVVWVAASDIAALVPLSVATLVVVKNVFIFNVNIYTAPVAVVAVLRLLYSAACHVPPLCVWMGYISVLFRWLLRLPQQWDSRHDVTPALAKVYGSAAGWFDSTLSRSYSQVCTECNMYNKTKNWLVMTGHNNEAASSGSFAVKLPTAFPGIKDFVHVTFAGNSLWGHVVDRRTLELNRHIVHVQTDWTPSNFEDWMSEYLEKKVQNREPFLIRGAAVRRAKKLVPRGVKMRGMLYVLSFDKEEFGLPDSVEVATDVPEKTTAYLVIPDGRGGVHCVTPSPVTRHGTLQAYTFPGSCGSPIYVQKKGKLQVLGYHNTATDYYIGKVKVSTTAFIYAKTGTTHYGDLDCQSDEKPVLPITLSQLVQTVRKLHPSVLKKGTSDVPWTELCDNEVPAAQSEDAAALRYACERGIVDDAMFDNFVLNILLRGTETEFVRKSSVIVSESAIVRFSGFSMVVLALVSYAMTLVGANPILMTAYCISCAWLYAMFGQTAFWSDCRQLIWHLIMSLEMDLVLAYPWVAGVVIGVRHLVEALTIGKFRWRANAISWVVSFAMGQTLYPLAAKRIRHAFLSICWSSRLSELIVRAVVHSLGLYCDWDHFTVCISAELVYRVYQIVWHYALHGLFYVGPQTFLIGRPLLNQSGKLQGGDGHEISAIKKKQRQNLLAAPLSSMVTAAVMLSKMGTGLVDSGAAHAIEEVSMNPAATWEEKINAVSDVADSLWENLQLSTVRTEPELLNKIALVNESNQLHDLPEGIPEQAILLRAATSMMESMSEDSWIVRQMKKLSSPALAEYSQRLKPSREFASLLRKLLNISLDECRRLNRETLAMVHSRIKTAYSEEECNRLMGALRMLVKDFEKTPQTHVPGVEDAIAAFVSESGRTVDDASIDALYATLRKTDLSTCSSPCLGLGAFQKAVLILRYLLHVMLCAEDYGLVNESSDLEEELAQVRSKIASLDAVLLERPRTKEENLLVSSLTAQAAQLRKQINTEMSKKLKEDADIRRQKKVQMNIERERERMMGVRQRQEENVARAAALIVRFMRSKKALQGLTAERILSVMHAAKLKGVTPEFFVKLFEVGGLGTQLAAMHWEPRPAGEEVREIDKDMLSRLTIARQVAVSSGEATAPVVIASLEKTIIPGTEFLGYVDGEENVLDGARTYERLRNRVPGLYVLRNPVFDHQKTLKDVVHMMSEASQMTYPCGADSPQCSCAAQRHDLARNTCYSQFLDDWEKHAKTCEVCSAFIQKGRHFLCHAGVARCGGGGSPLNKIAHTHSAGCCFAGAVSCIDCHRVLTGQIVDRAGRMTSEAFAGTQMVTRQQLRLKVDDDKVKVLLPEGEFVLGRRPKGGKLVVGMQRVETSGTEVDVDPDLVEKLKITPELAAALVMSMFSRRKFSRNESKVRCTHGPFPCPKCTVYFCGNERKTPQQLLREGRVPTDKFVDWARNVHFADSTACICDECIPTGPDPKRFEGLVKRFLASLNAPPPIAVR